MLGEVQTPYDPLLITLDKIMNEGGWDHKTTDVAHGLMRNTTDSTSVVALNVSAYTPQVQCYKEHLWMPLLHTLTLNLIADCLKP